MTYPLGAIIGYDCEVSVPNGPAVHGFILARWMDDVQPRFDEWLAEHDRQVAERAFDEGFDAAESDWAHHDESGWEDEDCLDVTYNPYRKETTW